MATRATIGQHRGMRRSLAIAFVLAAATAPLHARTQEPALTAGAKALLQRFDALPKERQAEVLRAVEERLSSCELPARTSQLEAAKAAASAKPARDRPFHDPQVFAPVAPARIVLTSSDARHQRVRAEFPRVRILRDLAADVTYDWLDGVPTLCASPLDERQRFANLAAGYLPEAARAIAGVLTVLDRDGDQRTLAAWCDHLYADRDGRVFDGVTLYEAWYSGQIVEVPDVDAIAFARNVLETQSFTSPIPDGARRDRLYDQIRAAVRKHREYRTLCEAAAAAFVAAVPELDPTYEPLLLRMHLLWGECGQDANAFAAKLTADERMELLRQLDDRIENGDALRLAKESQEERRALAEFVTKACAEALTAAETK